MVNTNAGLHALVTGGAGFIGSHVIEALLKENWKVTTIDNLDPFYDIEYKLFNLSQLNKYENFTFVNGDIRDAVFLSSELRDNYTVIIHLAAKAGVRPSINSPVEYQEVNVRGTQNLLEFARERQIEQFIFASSSSVYGVNTEVPWRESDYVLQPISPYASTKVSGELLGHVYSHLYKIRFIGLRFFSVYGPRQRPDLAIHKFTRQILQGEPIPVFGDGSTYRDYTYVDDIVQGVIASVYYTGSRYEIINLGNNLTISLSEMIDSLEELLHKKAKIQRLPMQPGDVPMTYADVSKAHSLLGYTPHTSFKEGLTAFKAWIDFYYKQ